MMAVLTTADQVRRLENAHLEEILILSILMLTISDRRFFRCPFSDPVLALQRPVPLQNAPEQESPRAPEIAIPKLLLRPGRMFQQSKTSAENESSAADEIPEIHMEARRPDFEQPPWTFGISLDFDDEE